MRGAVTSRITIAVLIMQTLRNIGLNKARNQRKLDAPILARCRFTRGNNADIGLARNPVRPTGKPSSLGRTLC